MAASIEDCPPEVIEQIVQLLLFDDIANLRLSSRSMASLTTQDTLKSYYLTKRIDLSKQCLQLFVEQTSDGRLGSLVQTLTVAGIAIDTQFLERVLQDKAKWITQTNGPMFMSEQRKCTPEELAKVEEDLEIFKRRQSEQSATKKCGEHVDLLAQAFRNIAATGKLRRLPTLTLSVDLLREDAGKKQRPIEGGNWELIWQAATDCFQTVIRSLAKSRLPVDALDIFNSTWRCSLSMNDLAEVQSQKDGLAEALASVKTLTVSLSEGLIDGRKASLRSQSQVPKQLEDCADLGRLIGLTPNLETLELHWYGATVREEGNGPRPKRLALDAVTQNAELPHLRSLTLRGIHTSEQSLLNLLQSVSIRILSMTEIHMTEGTFASVFEHCTSDIASLEELSLDDLWQERLMYFRREGRQKCPTKGNVTGGQVLERKGNDVASKKIDFYFPNVRPLGSPQAFRWMQSKRREFGPP